MSPASPNVGENVSHAVPDIVPAWKKELNERLAATRTRRLRKQEEQVALPGLEHMTRKVDSRASHARREGGAAVCQCSLLQRGISSRSSSRGRDSGDRAAGRQ